MACPVCKIIDAITTSNPVAYLRWAIQECYLETDAIPTLIAVHPRVMMALLMSDECLEDINNIHGQCKQVWLDGVLVIEQLAGNELLRRDSVVVEL